MGEIIAVANQKGGVGKTTTAVNLAACLAQAGASVWVVDLDPQSNATSGLGLNPTEIEQSVYHVLIGEVEVNDALRQIPEIGLSLLPATRDLAAAEVELVDADRRAYRLKNALEPHKDRFDYALIDCPPSLGLLTLNALTAASSILVPLQCEYYALEGISALLETVDMVRSSLNPDLALQGVLLTMFDTRNTICHQVADEARGHFTEKVYQTIIPRNVKLVESPSHGLPITLYDPSSRGAESYNDLAREILGARE